MGHRLTNLNDHLPRQWAAQHLRNLTQIALCLLLSLSLASGLIWLNSQKFAEIQPLVKQLANQKTEVKQQQRQIEQLKNQTATSAIYLSPQQINDFIQILRGIPTKSAGIEMVQIAQEETTQQKQLTFAGKYAKQQDFEQLQNYLSQFSQFTLKIDDLQSSEKYKTEFSLRLIPKTEED